MLPAVSFARPYDTRVSIGCMYVQRRVAGHHHGFHQRDDLWIAPTLTLKLSWPKSAIDERRGNHVLKAVIGGFAGMWPNPRRIGLLLMHGRIVRHDDIDGRKILNPTLER